jgi:DNA-binding response OmpR family regulator
VLVIDDDPAALDLVSRFLAGENFGVLTASGGEEGLRLARERHPDIITLDIIMPHVDGWAVLAKLKADPALTDIPVILISMTDDRNLGYALGASEYLTKPVDWNRLGTVLRRYARRTGVVGAGGGRRAAGAGHAAPCLERSGWRVAMAGNGRGPSSASPESTPRLILLT